MLHLPVLSSAGQVINISFYSSRPDAYDVGHLKLINRLNPTLTLAIEVVLPLQAFNNTENEFSISDLNGGKGKPAIFKNIIGDCNQLLTILDHVSIAAPIDTSILILGESGTGKEQIAKSIHELSPRRNNSLVIINCASLPTNLIESELFGHEKGSFTGAIEKRIGKFELADKGTIFLDEIGELPIEVQGKLLRVLQEQEIERIGGSKTIRINVRVIAATNRNLETEIREGRFRLDLYYRLSVFPIRMPTLRERKSDIPKLVTYFCNKFSRKFGKTVSGLSSQVMNSLQSHPWPGNIRELENFVERSVLLCNGNFITEFDHFSFEAGFPLNDKAEQTIPLTKIIDENVKEHILSVLKQCDGKISGAGGAAEHLGIPATTLHSKIKRLGLKKW
jgi:transcriptional regulator with GAF, ATPase, and Fis domain